MISRHLFAFIRFDPVFLLIFAMPPFATLSAAIAFDAIFADTRHYVAAAV